MQNSYLTMQNSYLKFKDKLYQWFEGCLKHLKHIYKTFKTTTEVVVKKKSKFTPFYF
jgi:hypothetical protein